MLLPEAVYRTNPDVLARQPAQAFYTVATGNAAADVVQVQITPPEGDRHLVLGTVMLRVQITNVAAAHNLRLVRLNLIDRVGGLVVTLWERANTAGVIQVDGGGACSLAASATGAFTFNPPLAGVLLPSQFNVQFVSQWSAVPVAQTLTMHVLGYSIPLGGVLR